jgi:Glucodextranase, domain B
MTENNATGRYGILTAMLPYRDSTLTKIALAVFFLVILGYAYFEARGILYGSAIYIAQSVEQVSTPYIELTGTTTHVASLSVNGQSVPVTEQGAFDIPYALSPGYNRIVLDASDKYGHSTQKIIQIVYTPSATSSTTVGATTTAATSTIQ